MYDKGASAYDYLSLLGGGVDLELRMQKNLVFGW